MIINNKLPFCLKRTNFNIKKFIWCFVPFHLKSLTMFKIKILSYSSGIVWKYMPGTFRANISILYWNFSSVNKTYVNSHFHCKIAIKDNIVYFSKILIKYSCYQPSGFRFYLNLWTISIIFSLYNCEVLVNILPSAFSFYTVTNIGPWLKP